MILKKGESILQKRTGKYYLKFTLIGLLIMVMIAFVVPAAILYGSEFYYRLKAHREHANLERQINVREDARNQGALLDETPEELLARRGIIYHDGDPLEIYYATEPIKVRSTDGEFIQYCNNYFGSESDVKFYYWEGECYRADYRCYTILRTELFNPVENNGRIYYEEDLGMEGMTDCHYFYYDATGKYALVKYDFDNGFAIAKFLGLTIDGKDEDYNPFVNQRYEQERERLDEERSVGIILEVAPDELTNRVEDTFDGTMDSLYMYYGASEPVKVSSDSDEFESFCREFFFDHPEPVTFFRSANETTFATCGEYEIYRTEYFNPTMNELGHLYYVIGGLEDGMSLKTEFVYDPTGRYAMVWYDCEDSAKYVLAKFIGLNFSEENPYVSPIQDELDKLSLREFGTFKGDIWKYVAYDSVVRVECDEEEFVQYCDEFFMDCDEKINYEQNRDGEIVVARCSDYIMLRTQFFDPIRYGESLLYEENPTGDTEPMRSEFFYDCTGKYALVYIGDDCQNQLCINFLGF